MSVGGVAAPTGAIGSATGGTEQRASSESASSASGVAAGGGGGALASRRHRPYRPVASYAEDTVNDLPLLEELGVDFGHIATKVTSVLVPTKRIDDTIMVDSDMAGPIAFCLILGFFLLLAGKVHFGYIYGFGGFGCVSLYAIFTLMSDGSHSLDLARTFSVLGYGLLPIVGLAGLAIVISLRNLLGAVLGVTMIAWCTYSATRFFEAAMHMQQQRWLIAYPTLLFYACFVLITVF